MYVRFPEELANPNKGAPPCADKSTRPIDRVQVYATTANPLSVKAEREKKARARAKNWAAASARSRPRQPRASMRDAGFLESEYDEDNIRDIKRGAFDDDSEEEDYSDSGARGSSKRRLDDSDDTLSM